MKPKITPHFFDGNLLISLSGKWLDVFKKMPEFEFFIDKQKRIVFRSEPIKEDI